MLNDSPTGSASNNPLEDKSGSANLSVWHHAELKPAETTYVKNAYSFQIHMDGEVSRAFEINDISIVYRRKTIK